MKAIIIKTSLLFLLVAGIFTSCSKNNDEKPDNKTLIVAVWQVKLIEYYFQPDGSTQKEFVSSEAKNQAIEFTTEGKVVTDGVPMSYDLSGDKLTITPSRGGEGQEFAIKKLDGNNLVIEENLGKDEYNDKTGTVFQVLTLTK